MVMRKCLNFGTKNYSANTVSEYWRCCKCGCKIPKSEETITGGNKEKTYFMVITGRS